MYKIAPLILYLLISVALKAQTKVVGECSMLLQIEQLQGSDWQILGQKRVLIKGNQCKTVLTSAKLQQTLIFNPQEDTALILKDIGESHFLQHIPFPPANQVSLIAMKSIATDTLLLLGYNCKKVQVDFSDGSQYDIVYTTDIIPTVPYYEMAFKDIPGLVLSYTISSANNETKVRYTATEIDLSPITLSQFEYNTLLYQVID